MKMEMIHGSETSAYINQTPGNYPKWNLLYRVSVSLENLDDSVRSCVSPSESFVERVTVGHVIT